MFEVTMDACVPVFALVCWTAVQITKSICLFYRAKAMGESATEIVQAVEADDQ